MSDERNFAQQQELDNDQMEQVAGGASRPSPAGDGTTEHFFTVEIAEGRAASVAVEELTIAHEALKYKPG